VKDRIAAIQRHVGVTADGIIGPATLGAIEGALGMNKPAASPRKINARAVAMMHHFEGCRLTAYKCPAGVWTIGWGNTFYANGAKVQPGDTITQATADALFSLVVADFERDVDSLVKAATDDQFGALVSFAYNLGSDIDADKIAEGLGDSTLLRLHNAGDYAGAAAEFPKWNKAGGQVSNGLVRRRNVERMLYSGNLAEFDKAIGFRP
jgi:lysozyme